MKENFGKALKIILREEGGNDDDPHDRGGRTSRGIIQREWDAFRRTHSGRPEDVWKASDRDIATIYEQQYWLPHCEWMPAGVDLSYFNAAVNSGHRQAAKELQRSVAVNADGIIGMITKTAVLKHPNPAGLIHALAERRRRFYQSLAQFPRYGRGWMARTDRVERDAMLINGKKLAVRDLNKRSPIAPEDMGAKKAIKPEEDIDDVPLEENKPNSGKAKAYPPQGISPSGIDEKDRVREE